MKNKKALGPVIAISLLVIVSVVAIIGFQSWYQTYSSQTYTNLETKEKSQDIEIDSIRDGILYVKNTKQANYTLNTIKVGNTNCNIQQNLSLGINQIDINECLTNKGTNDITLVTNDNIIEKKLFVKEIIVPSMNFISNVSNVLYGDDILLTWSTSNLNTCESYGDWTGSKNIDDNLIINSIKDNKTFILNCSGPYGNLSKTIKVNITSYPSCVNITDSLVGLWHLDNDALDSSLSGINGGPFDISYSNSLIGQSAYFDGNDYIDLPNLESVISTTGGTSYVLWFKPGSSSMVNRRLLEDYTGGNTANLIGMFSNGAFGGSIRANMGGAGWLSSGISSFNTNKWYFVVFTRNSTDWVKLYMDSNFINQIYEATNSVYSGWALGRNGDLNTNFYLGYIDEVAIYNKALTPEEIKDIYNLGLLGKPICDP